MRLSSRFKLSTALSLLLIFVVGLTLLGSTNAKTHAASTFFKPSTKLSVNASCGPWSVVSSANVPSYSIMALEIWFIRSFRAKELQPSFVNKMREEK